MDRNDRRRAEILTTYWDNVVLGRAATDPTRDTVGEDVAALIERLQALGDLPEVDSARDRVWQELEKHPRWKELNMPAPAFVPNGAAILPPLTWPEPAPPVTPRRRAWPAASLAQVAIALLVVAAIIGGSFALLQRGDPATWLPAVATPVPAGTPSADWPMYKGNPGRTSATSGPALQGSPVLLWRFQTQGGSSRSPAIAAGVAYLQSGDGTLYALDALTGEERWRYDAIDTGENTPTVVGDTVYLSSATGELVALDVANGAERWRFAETVSAESTPLVVDGVIYLGSDEGDVFAVTATTGEEVWRAAIGSGIGRSAATADGIVYVGTQVGQLVALDAASGAERWRFAGEDPTQGIGTPTVIDGVVYANQTGNLYALDAVTGAERWRKAYPGARPITAAGDLLLSGGLDGVVYAIDAASGDDRWTFTTGDEIQAAPAVVGGEVYVASLDRKLYALDLTTGAERWSYEIDGQVDYGPSVANGIVYAGTTGGSLYALGGSDLAHLAAPTAAAGQAATTGTGTPVASESSYIPVHFVWSIEAVPPAAFSLSPQLTVAPNGDLWVVDGERSGFQIFAPDGTLRERWGSAGDGEGEFSFQRDANNALGSVAFRADGGFYVADSQNHRIQQFDADRQFVRAWGSYGEEDGQFKDPIGVNLDQVGNVYVIDDYRSDVQKFTADGQFLLSFSGHGSGDGQISAAGLGAFDLEGNLWIADCGNNRLQKFGPDGSLLQIVGEFGSDPGQFKEPQSLAIDELGRIYVTDAGNERVQVLDRTGQFLYAFDGADVGGESFALWNVGIAVDDQWGLYVLQYHDPRGKPTMIQKFQLT